jgi:hypothetical protein
VIPKLMMPEATSQEEFEQAMDRVATQVRDEVIALIPQPLILEARAWTTTLGSQEALEYERDVNADAVDSLIQSLLPGANPAVDIRTVSPATIALLLDRLLLLPQFLKWIPPESGDLTAGAILYAWGVVVYRRWRKERASEGPSITTFY